MRYQWHDNASLIHEVSFSGSGTKTLREAIIHVPYQQQESESLQKLDDVLIGQGYNVSYDMNGDQPILRVSGIRTPKDLLQLLKSKELVAGSAKTSEVVEPSKSAWQKIRENSLVLSAVFYMLGNASTALSGWFRRDADELRTGLSFSVGDSFMLIFGKRSDKEKYEGLMQGFGEFMQKHGYTPSPGSNFAASAIKEGQSSWKSMKQTMRKLVIPVKSVSEIYAGYSFAKAGFNQDNPYKKIAGTALMSGFSLGLLIPERSKSQIRDAMGVDTPAQAKAAYSKLPWSKRAQYAIQRQPLILSGGFAALNNLSTLASALDERDNVKKTGENRQLAQIRAKLYGGTYRPSLFQAEKKVTVEDSLTEKVKASYHRIAQLDSRANMLGGNLSETARRKLLDLEKRKGEYESFIEANGGKDSKSLHTLEALKHLGVIEDKIINLMAPRASEKGETLGQLHHEKEENSKLIDERAELSQKEENLKQGRKIPFFGKVDQSKFWIFNMLQGGFFLVANTLYAMSSKSSSGDKKMTDRFLSAVATEVVKCSNIMEREEIISLAAQYGGNAEEMDYTAGEMRALLEERIAQLEQASPWLKKYQDMREQIVVEVTPEEIQAAKEQTAQAVVQQQQGEKAPVDSEDKAPLSGKEQKYASYQDRVIQSAAEAEQSRSTPSA